MDIWDKRRRNLKVLIALRGLNGASAADKAKLSVNVVNKFLRGDTKALRWDSLEKLCEALDVSNPAILDADNPFSDAKNRLYALIDQMSDEEAERELNRINSERK